MSAVARIGDNNPPGPIEWTRVAMADLSRFLTENPVIQSEEQAKEGALFVERTRKTVQDLEDARKKETGPLNEQVKAINETYRAVRDPIDNVLSELRRRLTDYTAREEARRIREAELARQAARDAEMEARRAEAAEQEAKQNATFGEVTDVATAVIAADQSFAEYKMTDRAATIAERETSVKLKSQLGGKALGLREKETLHIDNMLNAVEALMLAQMTDYVRDAILTAARAYRRARGELPPGIRSETKREI